MVNGFSFGVGVFCFMVMGYCLYASTQGNQTWFNLLLSMINGGLGILNMYFAFA